ncbi:hypothetical protein SCUCBS95973_000469 [Sporothrix curviconia]|uniref:Uncharacterized protein n=1 Tax=Sporothrix curviconia TaxID=1260050 RepID=A0ABP0AQN1_9PEZI
MNATEAILGYMPVIGKLVVPRNISSSEGDFDSLMHNSFELYGPARRGCYVEYDVLDYGRAVQYAYQLPWIGSHQDLPEHMKFEIDDAELYKQGDAYFLLANLEVDYFDLAAGCVEDACDFRLLGPPDAMLDLGENALWPALPLTASPMPDLSGKHLYDKIEPAYVFSLGASVKSRNMQLGDERRDCECSMDEHYRIDGGFPLNDEFPCNRDFAWTPH